MQNDSETHFKVYMKILNLEYILQSHATINDMTTVREEVYLGFLYQLFDICHYEFSVLFCSVI